MKINKDDLKLDYFLDKEKPLYQHPNHFRFNTDTKLLANFCRLKKEDRVLDIGCNNAALLYAFDQFAIKELVGVEIFEEACQVAQYNVEQFFKHPAKIVCSRIQDFQDEPFDVIVSNPPYFKVDATHPDISMDARQYGRVEVHLNLQELIEHAARLLKSNGRFYLVHRPNRLNDICKLLYQYHFQIQTLQVAYDQNIAKSLLIEARKESGCDCKILQPYFIK